MRGVVGTGCNEDHLFGGRGVRGGVGKRRKTKQDCKLGDMAAVSLLGLSKKKFYFFHLEKHCHLAIDGLSPSFVF